MIDMSGTTVREIYDGVRLRLVRTFAPKRYQEAVILHTASRYDMSSAPAEDFFARLYLRFISEDIAAVFGNEKIRILDAGCGQGRLSIPLAAAGHRVTGIDLSPDAIATARDYTAEAGLEAEFLVQDVVAEPGGPGDRSFDCVICTEMIYMVEDPEALLARFARAVRPGGLVIVSFRPKLYYLLFAVRNHLWKEAETISRTRGGRLARLGGVWLNWFTRDEIEGMLGRAGIAPVRIRSIGKFSGIAGDPQACSVNPADLSDPERDTVMELELRHAEENVENGRYVYTAGTVAGNAPGSP